MTKDEATTSPKDVALKLALDLAIMHHSDDGYAELRLKVRQLAKEALALTSTPCEVQPEQTPLAKVEPCAVCGKGKARLSVLRSCDLCHSEYAGQAEMKVALAQDELCSSQEPVAWTVVGDGKFGKVEIGQHAETDLDACSYWVNRGYSLVPLYTPQPQRPWVGLTDDERANCWRSSAKQCAINIEAKLKELNT